MRRSRSKQLPFPCQQRTRVRSRRELIIGVVPGVVENGAVYGCVAGLAYMDITMAILVRKHFARGLLAGGARWTTKDAEASDVVNRSEVAASAATS